MAQDFFSYEAGRRLPRRIFTPTSSAKGMDTLLSMIGEQRNSLAAAKTAAASHAASAVRFHDLVYEQPESSAQTSRSAARPRRHRRGDASPRTWL